MTTKYAYNEILYDTPQEMYKAMVQEQLLDLLANDAAVRAAVQDIPEAIEI